MDERKREEVTGGDQPVTLSAAIDGFFETKIK